MREWFVVITLGYTSPGGEQTRMWTWCGYMWAANPEQCYSQSRQAGIGAAPGVQWSDTSRIYTVFYSAAPAHG